MTTIGHIEVPPNLPEEPIHMTAGPALGITRSQFEDFLYREAALLDGWQLDSWLEMFCDDGQYVVPTADLPEGDPETDQVFVSDDMARLRARVERLKSRRAFREFPYARTRRFISNVMPMGQVGEDEVAVTCSFLINRFRNRSADAYVGRYDHIIRVQDGELRFVMRRATLDLEVIAPHGTISIIL